MMCFKIILKNNIPYKELPQSLRNVITKMKKWELQKAIPRSKLKDLLHYQNIIDKLELVFNILINTSIIANFCCLFLNTTNDIMTQKMPVIKVVSTGFWLCIISMYYCADDNKSSP